MKLKSALDAISLLCTKETHRGCPIIPRMPASVILNEVKNLMDLSNYPFEILRLTPQSDVVGQPPKGLFPSEANKEIPVWQDHSFLSEFYFSLITVRSDSSDLR